MNIKLDVNINLEDIELFLNGFDTIISNNKSYDKINNKNIIEVDNELINLKNSNVYIPSKCIQSHKKENIVGKNKIELNTYQPEYTYETSEKLTIEDIKNIMASATLNNKAKEVKEILQQYNVCRINQIKEENIDEIYIKIKNLVKH